jgi:multiple sugar transport system ATP-binding protein
VAQVRFDSVSKMYPGGVQAVREASLLVRDREFMVLVGPSGCGKSTMLRLVAGLEEVTSGQIFIGDRPVNGIPPKDRDIAMVFQSYALYPHMTVRDNMGFGLKLRKVKREEIAPRVERTAELLDLGSYLDRKPAALSGGQRQRVALGRAIVRQPAVFLFDEPLSNLDASLRVQTRTEISKLHRELDATMIYVTHDQVEAMTMADRIAVMKDGILHQVADPLTLYNHPVNRFVASFIGSPSMNFIEGNVEGGVFRAPGFAVPMKGRLEPVADRSGPATLGIRPEDIDLAGEEGIPASPGEDGSVVGSAESVEPMGNEVLLHADVSGTSLLARIGPELLPRVGATYRLRIDPGRAHLFDPRTGEAAIHTGGPRQI